MKTVTIPVVSWMQCYCVREGSSFPDHFGEEALWSETATAGGGLPISAWNASPLKEKARKTLRKSDWLAGFSNSPFAGRFAFIKAVIWLTPHGGSVIGCQGTVGGRTKSKEGDAASGA